MWHALLVALGHVPIYQTRHRTCVPCFGRLSPNHCTTREVWRSVLLIKKKNPLKWEKNPKMALYFERSHHVCTHTHMHTHTHTHKPCMCTQSHYTHACRCTHTHTGVCMHTHTCTPHKCTYSHDTCAHACMYMHPPQVHFFCSICWVHYFKSTSYPYVGLSCLFLM